MFSWNLEKVNRSHRQRARRWLRFPALRLSRACRWLRRSRAQISISRPTRGREADTQRHAVGCPRPWYPLPCEPAVELLRPWPRSPPGGLPPTPPSAADSPPLPRLPRTREPLPESAEPVRTVGAPPPRPQVTPMMLSAVTTSTVPPAISSAAVTSPASPAISPAAMASSPCLVRPSGSPRMSLTLTSPDGAPAPDCRAADLQTMTPPAATASPPCLVPPGGHPPKAPALTGPVGVPAAEPSSVGRCLFAEAHVPTQRQTQWELQSLTRTPWSGL